jgi:hypothetical protein
MICCRVFVVGIAFAAAAEEAPEGIAADAVLAPVAQTRAKLAAVDSRMGRLALVDLSLWTDDPVTARRGLFACKHEIDSFPGWIN